ncbi:MAG: outer membrane protein assembly factor BamD [Sphingobacteriaceae bacterium]|nr:outer membrane protein assembly factor BamD [Sphingobacteriaceae bacterium]
MFKNKYTFILSLSFLIFALAGCKSRFEKIRLSNDVSKKYQEAIRLYKAKKFEKALILFEDLSQKYRGRAEAEDLNYYYANTQFELKDYTTARYQYKYFADTYPTSKKAEECRYMTAYCYYLDSSEFSLDQENTYSAIDALQLFINLHPTSERVKQASEYISKLRDKLELKAFSNAKLYYTMGSYDISNYKAAVVALKNAQIDYPDIKYAEEMSFLIIKSQYYYAKNSYVNRQEERFLETLTYYNEFNEAYPKSIYSKEALDLKKDSELSIIKAKEILVQEAKLIEKYNKQQKESIIKKDTLNTIKTPTK